ncbi:GGDEF domain-containing protein [Cetobacterium somerae]
MKKQQIKFIQVFLSIIICVIMLSIYKKYMRNTKSSLLNKIYLEKNEIFFEEQKITPLEKKVLDNFNRIPKKEYPLKYIEICESFRPILVENSGQNIPSFILNKILSSKTLSPKQTLYILSKLLVLDTTSGNLVNTLKLNINYLKLAEEVNSNYDINRAKIGLSIIFNSLGGTQIAIEMLESIDLTKDSNYKNKAMVNYNLAEYYFSLDNFPKSIEYLNKLSSFDKNEDINYFYSILFLKEALLTNIYIKENNKELAHQSLYSSEKLLKKIKKNYFSNLKSFYDIALESYNLKYDITKFSELNLKKYLQNPTEEIDSIYIFKPYDLLFEYYYKIEDVKKYNELKKLYDNHILKLNNINNNIFTIYLIETVEHTYISKKNNDLYFQIGILIISLIIISSFSYIKIKELDKQARVDALSKIGNRLAFNRKLESLEKEQYSMLLFDIDNFKKINDTYGHDFGDEVIHKIGQVLKTIENKEISIFRIGGEEFAIIFTHFNKTFSIEICEYIRKTIECLEWKYQTSITISGGFSFYSSDIYIECDKRLYEAKSSGKNMIIYQDVKTNNNDSFT